MNSSSETWAPALDLTTRGMAQFDPARVQRAIEDGYEAGMNAGRAEALALGRQEVQNELATIRAHAQELFASLNRTIDAANRHEAALTESFSTTVAGAAIRVAEAVLRRELSDETEAAVHGVQRALAGLAHQERTTVEVNPEDLTLLQPADLPAGVTLEANPRLLRGDAMVETPDRTVDARLEAALQRALAQLEGRA